MFCVKPMPSAQDWLSVQMSPPAAAQVKAAVAKVVVGVLLYESRHEPPMRGPGHPVSGTPEGPGGPGGPGAPLVPLVPFVPGGPGGPCMHPTDPSAATEL